MNKTQKFLVPIYGLKNNLRQNIRLGNHLLLRNINLTASENQSLKQLGLNGDYNVILEVSYKYNPTSPSEPLPGIFLNILNKFDASLVVYGDGKVGVAAAIFDDFSRSEIIFSGKISYQDYLGKNIDSSFKDYYEKFSKAYDLRPVAFDLFRRSQDKFSNDDKTIANCTVLESIFVPVGEKSKKPFIVNGMKIMSFNSDEVSSIDSLIEYRNAIIHADRKKQLKLLSGSKYTYKWFEETFILIRKILYKYVENPWD